MVGGVNNEANAARAVLHEFINNLYGDERNADEDAGRIRNETLV